MDPKHARPLSPHLQVYDLPLTARLSISHRVTGVIMSFGLILVALAIVVVARGGDSYVAMQQWLAWWPAKLALLLFLGAGFFHWCHGVRHLLMDFGMTLARTTMDKYANLELLATGLLLAVSAAMLW